MSRTVGVLAAVLLVVPSGAQAPVEIAAEILVLADDGSRVTRYLDHLVNRIGPRLTSSDNLTVACEWARDEFRAMGIENARLEQWGTFPVGFNRGPWFGRVTAPEELALDFNTAAWSAGTRGRDEGPVRPCPRDEAELAELSAAEIAGTWFIDPPSRPRGGGDPVAAALLAGGAFGFLAGGRELLITGGNWRIDFDDLPEGPTAYLEPSDYQRIKEWLRDGQEVRVELDVRNGFRRGPIPLYNVIADIEGSEFPDQYVIVGGHIDSWDGATGTTDNGTGVATTLEAARLLIAAGAEPRRTIRFMLWGGEEQGLLGSRAYIEQHPEELERVSAVLVHDGGTNYVSGIAGVAAMIPTLERVFAPVIGLSEAMPFEVREIDAFFPIGSDHDAYCREGVPGFFWRQAGEADYRYTHHTQHDLFDAAIERYQVHTSKIVAIGALGLAMEDALLTREGFEYRGRRLSSPPTRRGPPRLLGITTDAGRTVTSVLPDSLAAKVGLRVGDAILRVGGDAVERADEIARALRNGPAETSVTIARDGAEITVPIEFER